MERPQEREKVRRWGRFLTTSYVPGLKISYPGKKFHTRVGLFKPGKEILYSFVPNFWYVLKLKNPNHCNETEFLKKITWETL
jgi:hypothetical protein